MAIKAAAIHVQDDEAQECLKNMQERMALAKIPIPEEDNGAAIAQSKIQRFPRRLRGIGGSDERYIVPTVVAIGPYHHGKPHLQKMEEDKLAAANRFFTNANGASDVADVYGKLLSIVGDVRGCYADDYTVRGFSDADLVAMMLVDGGFLLQFMMENRGALLEGRAISLEYYIILQDMMLLENQIPWLVLHALMEFHQQMEEHVRRFVVDMGDLFLRNNKQEHEVSVSTSCLGVLFRVDPHKSSYLRYKDYKPANLLDLLRFSQIFLMPEGELSYQLGSSSTSLLSSSAVELSQIGVKLTANSAEWFGHMKLHKLPVFGELSLSPIFLNEVTTCWLVNMAALELSSSGRFGGDCMVVSSYLSVLAMLMNSEEDVQQLRAKQLLFSTSTNEETLYSFKRLGQHLAFSGRYLRLMAQIEEYKRNRPLLVFLHRYLYNSYKAMTIASLFSIVGVLVGIFKTLMSKKQQ